MNREKVIEVFLDLLQNWRDVDTHDHLEYCTHSSEHYCEDRNVNEAAAYLLTFKAALDED